MQSGSGAVHVGGADVVGIFPTLAAVDRLPVVDIFQKTAGQVNCPLFGRCSSIVYQRVLHLVKDSISTFRQCRPHRFD